MGEDRASVVRFSFEMLEAFKQAVEEDE